MDNEKKPLILVVEDDDGFREMICEMLARFDFDTLEVSNGKDALAQATKTQPDLILLDISMPQIDGWDVIRSLKASPDTGHIKICFLTATEDPAKMNYALQQGALGYIVKSPNQFSIASFIEKVEEMLRA